MREHAIDRVAEWLDGATPADGSPPPEVWGCVEVFGHRKHYGRVQEIERFGVKMLRVDVPVEAAALLLGEPERFETHLYAGSAIFSLTPMTEESARKWAAAERPRPVSEVRRLPGPEYFVGTDENEIEDNPDIPF
ncbi:MAG: hypothetical protein AB7H90_01220 [Alphaproteobacteria bacterium]